MEEETLETTAKVFSFIQEYAVSTPSTTGIIHKDEPPVMLVFFYILNVKVNYI